MTKKKEEKKPKNTVEKCEIQEKYKEKDELNQALYDPAFRLKLSFAMSLVETKLKLIDTELSEKYQRPVVRKTEQRLKAADSIHRKLERKGYEITFENAMEKLNDIAGVRVICLYRDDIYHIADEIKNQKDIRVIKEKDYIENPKKSGYQSLHLILGIPFTYKAQEEEFKVELQIRSSAMDFWAGVDNQICYKKTIKDRDKAEEELKNYSTVIAKLDQQMLELRNKMDLL